jgi:hypothetical protein
MGTDDILIQDCRFCSQEKKLTVNILLFIKINTTTQS